MKKILLFLSPIFLIVLQAETIIAKPKLIKDTEFSAVKNVQSNKQIIKNISVKIELFNIQEDTILYVDSSLKVKPEYPGGVKMFNAHINIVLENPKNKKGDIAVMFIVEKDGSLSRTKIIKGIDEETDEEINEVLKNSPKWKPGEKEGKKVRCIMPLFLTINGSK